MTPLLSVQREALNRGASHRGFAYFMEQGLGKTLTSYADFLDKVEQRLATRLVVVCPNSFKSGWVDDAVAHGIDLDFFVWQAGMHGYLRSWMNKKFSKPPCLIVNWEAIRAELIKRKGKKTIIVENDLAKLIYEFIEPVGGRAMVVFDESIKAKTHNNGTTVGAMCLAQQFEFQRILSGKPITQGPNDLWAQMRLIGQLRGRDYMSFKTAFCKMGGFKMKQVMGAQNEDILAELIEPHVFRATKADWTDLPPKLYTIREYTMTDEMQRQFNSMYHEFVLWLNEEENVSVDAAITKYIKLAQIQCGWIYDENGVVRELVDPAKNPRLNLLKELITDEITGKVAIVYHHRPVFDVLMKELLHLNPAWIRGHMDPQDVSDQKWRFNNDPQCRAILLQDDASKYGHTLLGHGDGSEHRCFTTVFYENNYSLDTRSQIEDRNHRHGQTADSVLYIDLAGTPLDRNIVRALQRKEDIFQSVFGPLRQRP